MYPSPYISKWGVKIKWKEGNNNVINGVSFQNRVITVYYLFFSWNSILFLGVGYYYVLLCIIAQLVISNHKLILNNLPWPKVPFLHSPHGVLRKKRKERKKKNEKKKLSSLPFHSRGVRRKVGGARQVQKSCRLQTECMANAAVSKKKKLRERDSLSHIIVIGISIKKKKHFFQHLCTVVVDS